MGHENYEVSNHGRVRSLARTVVDRRGRTRHLTTRLLAGNVGPAGYLRVGVDRAPLYVHRLVMGAFVGPKPPGMEVRHLDGNPLNNALANLAYGTASENEHDKVRHGTHYWANKTHCPRNHPYDEANTRHYRGRRFCIACAQARKKAA